MKPEVTLKYLSYVANKKNKGQEGFTLIELLVVVIIIGVLAAVALPNLLGQVGKARETEGKNGIGTINRTQQSYHFEKGTFTPALANADLQANNVLGVIIPPSKYYEFAVSAGTATASTSTALGIDTASAVDNGAAQGTRDYSGAIDFDPATGQYTQLLCQADVNGTAGTPAANATACGGGQTEVK